MMSIKVSIIDDHPIVLEGLRNMLTTFQQIDLVGAYLNAQDMMAGLKEHPTDILLLDIQMPDKTGDELVPEILTTYESIKIITLTNIDSMLYLYNMIKLGVKGYILKTADPKTLIDAIEKVYEGNEVIDRSLIDELEAFTNTMKRESYLKPKLSFRETEILQYIVYGYSSQEIASKLFISIRTVEYYRLNILLKMNVKNTAALVRKALSLNLAKLSLF